MKEQVERFFKNDYFRFYSKYLPEAKKIGGHEFQALCPFHEDRKPSFNFNNENGTYFCHGCGKKGNAIHFYAKINSLDDRRDFPKILKGISSDFGIPHEEREKKFVASYDYTDAQGELLFQVCRFDPKDFRQRRPDGKGGWIWDLKGVQTVLYNLPNVLKGEEVLICEGEKDVESLKSLGFTATTSPMGAKKWQNHYNESLKGKDIILLPDNDNEGREHMAQVGTSLNGTTKSLKWLTLHGLPSKGDVSDWIASFQDPEEAVERLSIMLESATPYNPPKQKSYEDIVLNVKEFNLLDFPEKREYLRPFLKQDSINLICGYRGVGKTWFVWSICDSITKGVPFGPWECKTPVPCMILDGEMPTSDLKDRMTQLGIDSDRPEPLYIYSDALANQWGIPRAHLANESWRTKMESILKAKHIKLWVVDNLASLASGLEENSKKDWDPINQWLLNLRFQGISTVMLHHVSKEGDQRGTSAREDNLDISIILKTPHDYTPEDGARFVCHFSKARVATKDLGLIGDTEFKMVEKDGLAEWTFSGTRKKNKVEILRNLSEGISQKEIAEELGISRGQVSKIRTWLIKEEHLTPKGGLTAKGERFLGEN